MGRRAKQVYIGGLTDSMKEMNRLGMNPENIEEVRRLVMQDHRITVRMTSEAVGISIGTVETVLTEDLKLHTVCTKFVPKIRGHSSKAVVSGGSTRTMPHTTSQCW